jgi:hypothetical protein
MKVKVDFDAPLNPRDTETKTYGCRQRNPEICKWHSLMGVCAFVREDNICTRPSKRWPKQYRLLKSKEGG